MSRPAVARLLRRITSAVLLILTSVLGLATEGPRRVLETQAQQAAVPHRQSPEISNEGALAFFRSELFFGTDKPHGVVTEAEFQTFVDEHVTQRFPDGLTILKGAGQFRAEDRSVRKEATFVLIVLYPDEAREKCSRKLNEIREIYKDLFQQRSVLRVDDPERVWVTF